MDYEHSHRGEVCININGQNGPYFRTFRGLRQRDPLSPLLFNLAVDALDHILTKGKRKRFGERLNAASDSRGDHPSSVC